MTSVAPTTDRARRGQFVELGVTGLETSAGRVIEEKLRQLKGRQGLLLYAEMRDNDPVVGASLTAMENLVLGMKWDVERAGDDKEDVERAAFLKSNIGDMSHSWSSFISEVLSYWVFGWQWTETVFKIRDGVNRQPGLSSRFDDGKIGIRKLAPRAQESLGRWQFSEDDNTVEAMIQRALPRFDTIVIPIGKSLLFTTTSRKRNPEGRSALRNAVRSYLIKKRLEEVEGIGIERDATGLPLITAPSEWFHADASTEQKALLLTLKKIGRNIRMDEQGCIVLPSALDPKTGNPTITFQLIAAGGRRVTPSGPTIERWNRLIAMTLLTDVILMGHEKVGSFSLASSKTTILSASLGAYADGIEDVLNRHLVPRLFALNGMSIERLPRFTHGDIETRDIAELGAFIKQITDAGAPLFPSDQMVLERHLMEMVGLPAPVPEE